MDGNVKFKTIEELREWLEGRGVDEDDVDAAATALFTKGFNKRTKLLGISIQELKDFAGIVGPIARELSNLLQQQQQQQQQQQPQQFSESAVAAINEMVEDYVTRKRTIRLSDATQGT